MEIAALLKQPVDECKNCWKNIHNTLMRHKRNKKLPTGSARPKKVRQWHLEEHLVFLHQVECKRETLTNTATAETHYDNIDYEGQQTEDVEMDGHPDDPHNEATELFIESNISDANIANTSIAGRICEQQQEGMITEAKYAYKRQK